MLVHLFVIPSYSAKVYLFTYVYTYIYIYIYIYKYVFVYPPPELKHRFNTARSEILTDKF